jgi:hypothetical protein
MQFFSLNFGIFHKQKLQNISNTHAATCGLYNKIFIIVTVENYASVWSISYDRNFQS